MSHELRTPLSSVIGFTSILLRNKKGNLSPKEIDYLQRIQSNGSHLLTLIDDILDLSKIESGEFEVFIEPVSLGELVPELLSQIEGKDGGLKATLTCVVPSEVPPVQADEHRLKQVLLNLIANGVKFAVEGTVTVEVVVDRGKTIRVDVSDTGIGIPEDRLEAIFEPFQQADLGTWRRFGGTGLGLAICRSLCHAMGFALTASSVQGQGSTFSIDLVADLPAHRVSPGLTEAGVTRRSNDRRVARRLEQAS